jgi:hypothetical protein
MTQREAWTEKCAAILLRTAMQDMERRRNAHPEQGVVNAVMQVLRLHPKVAWRARMNSGAYKTPDGRFVRFGFPGCPDIIGQLRDGRILMLECKAEDGRVTEDQEAVLETCRENNGVCGVVRTIDDALAILDGA